MEPTRLANSNHLVKSNLDAVAKSWEEEAFTEDATGLLGAFIWPPRSYNCVFCGREFRSAQALGGHMNIHRRDRAKLKRPLSPPNDLLDHDCKRHRRISEVSLAAFPITSSYVDNSHLKKKVVRVCPGAADELDLELRLGLKPNPW